jgi:E3 ubiquitin-protein ligase DOA10
MERPNCRFCLDEHDKQDNRLITPCQCIGSVQYVHAKCLVRWRAVAPPEFINLCQLCRFPYDFQSFRIELLPNERGFLYQVLISPYIFTFGSKYISFMFSGLYLKNYSNALAVIQYQQILIHLLYFYLFRSRFFVNNRRRYFSTYFKRHRVFIILLHLFFWYFSTSSENVFLLYLVDIFLPFYWHTHMRVLGEINDEIFE